MIKLWNEKEAWSLVAEVDSFQWELLGRSSEATDEMFGVITTVSDERVWRCKEPSQVSRTATSKRRSQSFCLSVFLPPASLSRPHLWASLTPARQKLFFFGDYFYLQPKKILTSELIVSFYSCLCEDPALLSFDIYTGLWMESVKTSAPQRLHPCCLEQNMTEPGCGGQIREEKISTGHLYSSFIWIFPE